MVSPHQGIGVGTASEILTAWNWEPTALAGLGLLGGLYAAGCLRSRGRRGRLVPWWRPTLFYAGLFTLLLALVSPIDALGDHLFFMHMIQHSLLIMVAAPLLVLGAPIISMLRGLPRSFRRRVVAPLARASALRWALTVLTLPRVAFVFFFGSVWVWHIPALYDEALRNEPLHILEHGFFTGTAVLFWWAVIDPVPFPARLGYPARMLYLLGAATPNAILGAYLTLSPVPWYAFYQTGRQLWGFTPMEDQTLGGVIMWLPGWMMFLFAISIVFFLMMDREDKDTRAREKHPGAENARVGPRASPSADKPGMLT